MSPHLDNSIDQYSIDEQPQTFENTMIANETFRQAAYDEMCILYAQIALESSDKKEVSKKFANQSLEFFEKKLYYVFDEDRKTIEDLQIILQSIIDERFSLLDIQRGLSEIKILEEKTKNTFDAAKANYYKILT
jgi:hypothetical protein